MSRPASLRPRIVSAIVYGILLIGCLMLHAWAWRGLLLFFAVVLLYELSGLFWRDVPDRPGRMIAIGAWGAITLGMMIEWLPEGMITWSACFWILTLATLFQYRLKAWMPVLFHALTPLYIILPILLAESIRGQSGPVSVLLLFLLLWADDVGAYFIGSWWGKTPFAAQISPKKTWEGTIGGAILAALVGSLAGWMGMPLTPWQGVILGLVVALFGTVGDLFESMIKRHYGIKDSGTIMPGHGGLLDRLDSFLVAMTPYYIMVVFFSNQ
ncbi:MAG TPA: CDP-archaeol synthase [Saprospiraceae bacterium]|nr:CDP-archaeol synthase [Saprospiraceae bacterium]MCB9270902.1 CDP-archaeol synthase [Lewinellaceae bacterium]HPG09440.1 CDP-archaeol synthase [Saprospiraceae bacterium]HPR02133.1 CDP-archaeol synthase [Saprospiraceae bacterium]HQU51921.1 CDP-archaeol synthase [Saprospiraceae bacterium]